jgi:hypothetical protein
MFLMLDVCVIHLVWYQLGLEPFVRFIESYRRHPAGIGHQLRLVFKEFPDNSHIDPYLNLLGGIPYLGRTMPGSWLDIPAYLAAAKSCTASLVCMLNSNSEILADDWLAKMCAYIVQPGVGLVGASGSWESHRTASELHGTAMLRQQNQPLTPELLRQHSPAYASAFAPFPNHHIRTNAFLLSRERLLGLPYEPGNDKIRCWIFESGLAGLTQHIINSGLRPIVVGRDGVGYEKEVWRESRTFRSGEQENLLVADNRTRDYLDADPAQRRFLFQTTWGEQSKAQT